MVRPLLLLLALAAFSAPASLAQKSYCSTSRGNVGNGYHYEMWLSGGTSGTACLTVQGTDARFKTEWNLSSYGFVARVGLMFDETRTDEQIGWITSDFAHTRTGSGQAWMGIYGWMVDPLKEYYIVEDWVGWKPQYTRKGTITVDGGEYDVYTNTQVQKPSVKGTQTFEQWYSVRKTARQEGRISVSEHFAAWRSMGLQTGKLYEAKLKVEGLGGSGTVEFTQATVKVGAKPSSAARTAPKSLRPAWLGPLARYSLDGRIR